MNKMLTIFEFVLNDDKFDEFNIYEHLFAHSKQLDIYIFGYICLLYCIMCCTNSFIIEFRSQC